MKGNKAKSLAPKLSEIDAAKFAVVTAEFVAGLGSQVVNYEDVSSVRLCAINDLVETSQFLRRVGADQRIWKRFRLLAIALDDLKHGTVEPILRATNFGKTRRPDFSAAWEARAMVAVALDCLLRAGMTRPAAARIVAQRGSLKALLRPRTILKTSCLNWLDTLRRGTNKNLFARALWNERHQAVDVEKLRPGDWQAEARRFLSEAEAGARNVATAL